MSGAAAGASQGRWIAVLDASAVERRIIELCELLAASVNSGGGVGFMAPITAAALRPFWEGVVRDVAAGSRVVVAGGRENALQGSVQLVLPPWPNQPHRADVSKLLVLPAARRQGLARALMTRLETEARTLARTLLVLDTESDGPAERLYASMGFATVGRIPDFALKALGDGLTDTTVMYKRLAD